MVASVEQSALIKVENKDDNRKRNKPIMERRRRARINNCLNELKALILDAMKKDPSTHSKLEKADILEMTVKHLGCLRSCEPDGFRAGYRRCLFEVARFPGLEIDLKRKLVKHLEGLVPGTRPPVACTPPSDTDDATVSSFLISAGHDQRVHLVPSRLSNGDIAFLLPASLKHTLERIPSLAPLSPEPFSAASSRGSPPPADLGPLPLVTRKTLEDKPWRPW